MRFTKDEIGMRFTNNAGVSQKDFYRQETFTIQERIWKNLKGFEGFYLDARARIWP